MAPPGSRTSLVNVRPMPSIHEDDDDSNLPIPALPQRSHLRSASGGYGYANGFGGAPPPYSQAGSDGTAPDRDSGPHKEDVIKDNEWFQRRGGWKRLTIMALVLTALIVGLGVGLTIGLRNRESADQPSAPALSTAFPVGTWTFTTALRSISTACTSNGATFGCYPFQTWSPATADVSAAAFHWTIAAVSGSGYSVSSSANPFAPVFTNLPLTVVDAGRDTERLTFSYSLALPIVPSINIVEGQQSAATCTFDSTVLGATLWMRRRASYPVNVTAVPAPGAASDRFPPWPYRVDISETQLPGKGVPQCVSPQGTSLGDFSLPQGSAGPCGCWYTNYGLGNGTLTEKRWSG